MSPGLGWYQQASRHPILKHSCNVATINNMAPKRAADQAKTILGRAIDDMLRSPGNHIVAQDGCKMVVQHALDPATRKWLIPLKADEAVLAVLRECPGIVAVALNGNQCGLFYIFICCIFRPANGCCEQHLLVKICFFPFLRLFA